MQCSLTKLLYSWRNWHTCPSPKVCLHLPWLIWSCFSPSLENGLLLFGFLVSFWGSGKLCWHLLFWRDESCSFPLGALLPCAWAAGLCTSTPQLMEGGKQREGRKRGGRPQLTLPRASSSLGKLLDEELDPLLIEIHVRAYSSALSKQDRTSNKLCKT